MRIAAIVPAGGQASRLGHAAKPYLSIGGQPLLAHVVAAVRAVGADPVIVVGPPPPISVRDHPAFGGAQWTREQPPGGGPAAAVAAGMAKLPPEVDRVLLLAADVPGAAEALPELLAARGSAAWAVVDGRTQPLLSVWDRELLAGLDLSPGGPLHRAMAAAGPTPVTVTATAAADADTWHDLVHLRRMLHQEASMTQSRMHQWTATAAAEAGVPGDIDVDAILDLAREAAHNVERPAAPLTTYLLGYAAAAQGLDPAGIAALADRLATLARQQPVEE